MTWLSDEAIVRTWERGVDRSPLERALVLLASSSPDVTRASLLDHPIGARDAALVATLRATFGDRLEGFAACPECGAELEIPLDLPRLVPAAPTSPTALVRVGEREITYRLPSTRDVLSVASLRGPQASDALVRRCVVAIAPDDPGPTSEPLTREELEEIARAMEAADAAADVELSLECPSCAHAWTLAFDPPSFLWSLVQTRAKRLFDDVDRLARAYGWTEREILALGPRRREVYLAMAAR